jgi:hypothetical protein
MDHPAPATMRGYPDRITGILRPGSVVSTDDALHWVSLPPSAIWASSGVGPGGTMKATEGRR